jgi:hypothetical protein
MLQDIGWYIGRLPIHCCQALRVAGYQWNEALSDKIIYKCLSSSLPIVRAWANSPSIDIVASAWLSGFVM